MVYSDRFAARAVLSYKSEEVFFKLVAAIQKAYYKFDSWNIAFLFIIYLYISNILMNIRNYLKKMY